MKNLTKILCRKRIIILFKIHDRVMSSCLTVGMMVTKNYLKFQNYTSKGIGNKFGDMKNLTTILSKKGHNFVQIHDKSYILLPGSGDDSH